MDRSLEPAEGNLVVAVQDGELVLRVIAREGRHKMLKRPDGAACREDGTEVWETVRATVRLL